MSSTRPAAPLYTTEVLRLAAALRGERALERVDGQAELGSPTCGSRISLSVQLDAAKRVQCMSQKVHACAFGQASAALLEAKVVGLDYAAAAAALVLLSRWLTQEQDEIAEWPELSALAPARTRHGRHGAILLPLRTLVAALEAGK